MDHQILQIGHPTLRKKARELTKDEIFSEKVQALISEMCDLMRAAPGVGLAAPQIGQSVQIIVMEDRPEYTKNVSKEQLLLRDRSPFPLQILINPKIVEEKMEKAEFFEGCLSIEGYIGVVPRAREIRVEALDHKAEHLTIEAKGWYARILQHEIDHLNGVLCTDRTEISTLMTVDNYVQFWLDVPISQILGQPD